jgi:hypothetical protein
MSMDVTTVCVTCGVGAPDLGDGGYIGRPSLEEHSWNPEEDVAASFGYIHMGLAAIGMVTWEVSRYREFLLAHQGHDLRLSADGSIIAARTTDAVPAPSGALAARFEQKCHDCRRRRWSQHPETVVPRPEMELSSGSIDLFVERVPSNMADCAYHAEPFGDDEARRVASFLGQHRGHRVTSSFLPEADVPSS